MKRNWSMKRRLVLAMTTLALAGGVGKAMSQTHAASGNQGVRPFWAKGRLLPWYLELQYPWVGGSFYQLEELIHSGSWEPPLRELMEQMRDLAREKDAVLIHIDDLLARAKGRATLARHTDLVIMAGKGDISADFQSNEAMAWATMSKLLVLPDAPPPARVTFRQPPRALTVGKLPAYTGIFSIEDADKGNWCRVIVLVPLGTRGTHLFVLNVAAARLQVRFDEMTEMLKRMSYEPGLLQEAMQPKK